MATTKRASKKKGEQPTAAIMDGTTETPIPVEEVREQPKEELKSNELSVITAEQKANQEVARFNIPRAWISAKKTEYEGLTIASVEDKEGEKKVKTAWQEVRNKRLAVQDKHEEIKADYLVITRAIDKEKRELVELLKEVEDPLKKELDRIEAEREAIKQKAEREAQEKLQGRVSELLENGMQFNGSYYAIGDTISMDVVTLKNLSDADYAQLLSRVQTENRQIVEAREAEEKRKKDEQEALDKQKQEQEETAKKLKDQQDEIDRQKKELREQVIKARASILEGMGLTYSYNFKEWALVTMDCGSVRVPIADVETQDAGEWSVKLSTIEVDVKQLKADQAKHDSDAAEKERLRKEQEEKDRKAAEDLQNRTALRKGQLMGYGLWEGGDGNFIRTFKFHEVEKLLITKSQILNYDENAWFDEMQKLECDKSNAISYEDSLQVKKDKEDEAKRLAALSDADRVRDSINKYRDAIFGTRPEISEPAINAAYNDFVSSIERAMLELQEFLKCFK